MNYYFFPSFAQFWPPVCVLINCYESNWNNQIARLDLQAHEPQSRLCEIYIISALVNTLISPFEVHVTHFPQNIKITSHTSVQLCNCSRSYVCISHSGYKTIQKNSNEKETKIDYKLEKCVPVSQPSIHTPKITPERSRSLTDNHC